MNNSQRIIRVFTSSDFFFFDFQDCVLNNSTCGWGQAMGQQPSNQKLVKQTGSLDSSVNSLSASFTSAHSGGSPRTITPSTPNRNTQFTEVTIQDRSGYVPHVNRKTSASWEGSQVTLSSHRSPVSDVPFKFNELVKLTQETRKSSSACVAQIPHVDVHSYRYDFELERSVMRDSTNTS